MGRATAHPRAAVAVVLLAALAVAALPAAAGARNVRRFKLVIEGKSDVARSFQVSGPIGLCQEQAHGTFTEHATFLRGRGVTLEISRRRSGGGWQYSVRRVGHGKSEFTVVTTRQRGADGVAELVPDTGVPASYCPAPKQELKNTPGCGTTRTTREDVGLKIIGTTSFTVKANEDELAAPRPKPTCGETSLTEGFLSLEYEFPNFVDVAPAALPEAAMFGRAKAVVVKLSGEVPGDKAPSKPIGGVGVAGDAFDYGAVHVTVRFIRCGEAHLPAC